jgi:hypothetical protein
MDVDSGPIILYILILYTIVFLASCAIVLISAVAIFWGYKRRPLWSHRPLFALALLVSILGGLLALQFLKSWDRTEESNYWAEYQAFEEKMVQQYPLELKYQPDSPDNQPFKIVFKVPVKGKYHLHVFGFSDEQSKHFTSINEAVIKLNRYFVPLEAGTNELSFGFVEAGFPLETIQSINFIVVIEPEKPCEQLIKTQKGIAVTNAGSVVLTEGINYYSPGLYATNGCKSNIYQWVPCMELAQLQVTLT